MAMSSSYTADENGVMQDNNAIPVEPAVDVVQEQAPVVETGPLADAAAAPVVTPSTTPAPMTVAGGGEPTNYAATNLASMLDSDSKLMQLARTEGKQYSNSRGLLNSSLAAGHSENAMIRNATPIATADALASSTADRDYNAAQNAQEATRYTEESATGRTQAQIAANAAAATALETHQLLVQNNDAILENLLSDFPPEVKAATDAWLQGDTDRVAPTEGVAGTQQSTDYKINKAREKATSFASFWNDNSISKDIRSSTGTPTTNATATDMGFAMRTEKEAYTGGGTAGTPHGAPYAKIINKEFGNWDNAVNAVRLYLGDAPDAVVTDDQILRVLGDTINYWDGKRDFSVDGPKRGVTVPPGPYS